MHVNKGEGCQVVINRKGKKERNTWVKKQTKSEDLLVRSKRTFREKRRRGPSLADAIMINWGNYSSTSHAKTVFALRCHEDGLKSCKQGEQ